MMDIMDGRHALGHLKPLSKGFEVFDLDGIYRGKVNRPGEAVAMLKQFDAKGRNQHTKEDSGVAPTKLSQREVAREAGISRDQQVQAVRVANVPRAPRRRA